MRLSDAISITRKGLECRYIRTGLQFETIPGTIEVRFKRTIARSIPLVCRFRLVESD